MKAYRYIVLGNGNAGYTAAKTIREIDPAGSILLVGEESSLPYSRPMLTKVPLRNYDLSSTILSPASWYQEQGIDLLLNTRVTGLDVEKKQVTCGQEIYSYEKCVYALGASNFIPPIPGVDKKEVASIRTYEDIYRLKRLAVDGEKAVVIGGGVIGLEAASELTRYGLEVVLLEALPMLMPRLLDEETARTLQHSIDSFQIHTDVKVEEITGETKVEGVRLADGRFFPADLVIISTGVKANVDLAKEAGLEVNRCIPVNLKMETSAPDVWACGDCVECSGINCALWTQATQQGITAGTNAAGGQVQVGIIDSSMVLNTETISVFALGDTGKDPDLTYRTETLDNMEPKLFGVNQAYLKSFEKRFYVDDELVGATIVGNLARMQMLKDILLKDETEGDLQ